MPYIAPFTGEYPAENTPTLGRVADYGQYDSQIARGIRSAFTGAKSSLQGFAGMGAELLGAEDYARQLYDYALQNQRLAEEQGPRVRTIRQVMESENPLSAGVDYLAGTAGQTTPYLLLGGAGALAGRGLGLVSGLRAGLSGEALAARAATGAGWGGTASIHPVMAGDQAVQLQEDPAAAGMGVGERALRANVVGGLQSAANALAPAVMVNQTFSRGARQALHGGGQGVGSLVQVFLGVERCNVGIDGKSHDENLVVWACATPGLGNRPGWPRELSLGLSSWPDNPLAFFQYFFLIGNELQPY